MPQNVACLESVELRSLWSDEAADFTPWLASKEGIAILSETLDMDLEVQGIEVPVGPYAADIVALDASSNANVIIENQFGKTDHDHLGKAITYASGLGAQVIVWIALYKEESKIEEQATWEDAFKWLREKAELFITAFSGRVQSLSLANTDTENKAD